MTNCCFQGNIPAIRILEKHEFGQGEMSLSCYFFRPDTILFSTSTVFEIFCFMETYLISKDCNELEDYPV